MKKVSHIDIVQVDENKAIEIVEVFSQVKDTIITIERSIDALNIDISIQTKYDIILKSSPQGLMISIENVILNISDNEYFQINL